MEEQFENVKNVAIKVVKSVSKPIIIIALIIAIVVTLLAGFMYIIKEKATEYREGDSSSTPYMASTYTSDISIGENGSISTNMTAQELWNTLLQSGSDVDDYLSGPSELWKLMNAQLVTQYPDTRPLVEDEDGNLVPDEIDWDALSQNVDSSDVQGIIKIKRAQTDGTTKYLQYVDPVLFYSLVDVEDKEVFNYYTLQSGSTSANMNATLIAAGTEIEIPSGLGSVHTYMGWQCITSTSSLQYKLREQAGMTFNDEGFGIINGRYVIACTSTFGTVGQYVDFYQEDGTVIPCIIGDIKSQGDEGCNEWGHLNGTCIIEFVVNKDTWYSNGAGSHTNPGTSGFHSEWNQNLTKAIVGESYFDNPNFTSDSNIEASSGGDLGDLCWPAKSTQLNDTFRSRTNPVTGAQENHKGVDIDANYGDDIYACAAGTVIIAGTSTTAGNWVVIDHGNGYVSKYMHNSKLLVSKGDVVTKGQKIAEAGSTGQSTGVHAHFQVELNNQAIDPMTLKYSNGLGSGTQGQDLVENSGDSTDTTTDSTSSSYSVPEPSSNYYVVVATWDDITEELTVGETEAGDTDRGILDFNNQDNIISYEYHITTTNINYTDMIKNYTMPFDYLWTLLVVSDDKDFAFDLADLVYDSSLVITVFGNLTTTTTVDTYTYDKEETVKTNYSYFVGDDIQRTFASKEDTIPYSYETVHTTTTRVVTLNVKMTEADTWIVKYTNEFNYEDKESDPEVTEYDSTVTVEPQEIDETETTSIDRAETDHYANITLPQGGHSKRLESHNVKTITYKNIKDKTTITVKTKGYTSVSGGVLEPKVEKDADEPNFVTLMVQHVDARSNILELKVWLFEFLEKNKNTAGMVDLTKYLLYKVTENDYGVTEFDFDIFDPDAFISASGSGIYGGTIQEKIWWAVIDAGYSEYAAAGVLGNASVETGDTFDTAASNGTHWGIFQWDSDRIGKLKSYAQSKGVEWTDEDTQVEFLIAEITPGGKGIATYQLMSAYQSKYDKWKNATTPEDAAEGFAGWFERCGTQGLSGRKTAAKKYYDQFHGKSRSTVSGSAISVANGTAKQKLSYLFPNGLPTTNAQCQTYMTTIQVPITTKSGTKTTKALTVHKAVAQDVMEVFQAAQNGGFQIYDASGYCFRKMNNGGSGTLSHHSYGIAIDINVNENYSHRGGTVYAGSFWNPSTSKYSIPANGILVQAFKAKGWSWGGNWSGNYQDYMHFSFTGN